MKSLAIPLLGIITLFWTASVTHGAEDEWHALGNEAPPIGFAPDLIGEELDELVGPLALHADALIALILPASTFPADIVLAKRFLDADGSPDAIDDQAWDESVRSLAHNRDLVNWLDDNLEWTIRLGEAFSSQPTDVMNAIQRMRMRAQAAGTLQSTPQQQIIVEKEYITIVPTQPDIIYVPYYDPAVVYVRPVSRWRTPTSFFSFSVGFSTGYWLSYDCDWRSRRIWHSDRSRYRHIHSDWRYPRFPGQRGYVQHPERKPWTPPHVDWRHRDPERRQPARSVAGQMGAGRRAETTGGRQPTFSEDTRRPTPNENVRTRSITPPTPQIAPRADRNSGKTTKRTSNATVIRTNPPRTVAPSYSPSPPRTERRSSPPPVVVRQPRRVAQPSTSYSRRSASPPSTVSSPNRSVAPQRTSSPPRTVAAPSTAGSGRSESSSGRTRSGSGRKAHEN